MGTSRVAPIVNLGNQKIFLNVSRQKVNAKSIHFVTETMENAQLSRKPQMEVNVNLRVGNVHPVFVRAEIYSVVQWERGSGSTNLVNRCQTLVN